MLASRRRLPATSRAQQGAPHRPVRDPRVRELRPVRHVPEPLVEAQRMRLRVQVHGREPTRACRSSMARTSAAPTPSPRAAVSPRAGPASRPSGHRRSCRRRLAVQQPPGAERHTVRPHGQHVHRARVVRVVLEVLGHPLLDDEDLLADREARLAGRPGPAATRTGSAAPAVTRALRARSGPARAAGRPGSSLSNSTHCPSAGCSKPSRTACSHCRVSPSRLASVGSAPYVRSPTQGWRCADMCTRIWCVRPVSSLMSSS